MRSIRPSKLFFMVLVCSLAWAPCWAQERPLPGEPMVSLTDEEKAWLQAHPDIQLAYTDSLEPDVIVHPDGRRSGILVDFLDALNKRLGTHIGLYIDSIPGLLEKAKNKEVDGILNLHPEYAERLGLEQTRSFWNFYPTVFARRDEPFAGPEDFESKRVAIIDKVYFSQKLMDQYGGQCTLLKVENALEGLRSVEKGQADYFLGGSINAYFISKYQLFGIVPAHVFLDYSDKFGIGIRSDWPELVSILNKGIASFSEEDLERIVAKWSHLPIEHESIALTPEEQAWLAKKPEVRVRVTSFPPYIFTTKEGIEGISIDYLKGIAKRTGIHFVFVPETRGFWDAIEGLVNLQGPDLIPCMNRIPEREDEINFSQNYTTSPRVIFTRIESAMVAGIEELHGKTLAMMRGSESEQVAVLYPEISLQLFHWEKEALRAVSIGQADAYIGDLTLASYLILEHGFTNLKVAAPSPLKKVRLSFGIRRDWPELCSIINKALATLSQAERSAIRSRYMAIRYEHGITSTDVLKWVGGILGAAVIMALLFFTWNRQLSRKVRDRTDDLARSEMQYKSVVEDSPGMICRFKPDGIITFVNQAYCAYFGKAQKELVGRDCYFLLLEEDRKRIAGNIAALIPEAPVQTHEHRVIDAKGDVRWQRWTNRALFDGEGRITAYQSFGLDFTDRKKAEDNLRQMRTFTDQLIQTANVMIIGLDGQGKIIHFNPAAERITGYTLSEIKGKNCFEILVPFAQYPEVHAEFSRVLEGGSGPDRFENPILTKGGEERFISWSNSQIRQGDEVAGTISFGIDITPRKQAEERLNENQLRLRALASELTIAEERERRRIAADLHDHVQQSLAAARLQLAAARKSASPERLDSSLDEISGSLREAIQDIRQLVFDLSSPSMNEIGLAAAVSEWLQEQIENRHGMETEFVDEIGKIPLDDDLRAILFRSVRELLANVVKHARAGRVIVSLKREGPYLKITVRDNGIGFDPEDVYDKVGHKGGFGLFSIRERMGDLGGGLELISKPGEGCEAVLTAKLATRDKGNEEPS